MAHRVIGGSPARPDAWEKVRGRPIYAGDLALPGMLHGLDRAEPVRVGPHRAARHRRAARALPGVVGGAHARTTCRATSCAWSCPAAWPRRRRGAVLATQPVLAADRVRFQGEPVALIAAETPEVAARAAELVELEYEELPGVYDPLRRARAGRAAASTRAGTFSGAGTCAAATSARAFARAAVIVEHTYRTPFVDHAYLETETGIGWIDAEGVARAAGEHPGARALPRRGRVLRIFRTAASGSRARTSAAASAARKT